MAGRIHAERAPWPPLCVITGGLLLLLLVPLLPGVHDHNEEFKADVMTFFTLKTERNPTPAKFDESDASATSVLQLALQ